MKINLLIKSKNFITHLKSSILKIFKNTPFELSEIAQENLKPTDLLFFELENLEDVLKASKVKPTLENTEIVFSSEREEFIFEVLSLKPLYFVRQNHLETDMPRLEVFLEDFAKNNNTIFTFQSGGLTTRLDLKNVIYIESYGHYLTLHTANGEYRVREKISKFIEDYPFLIRCHKSYIINPTFIERKTSSLIFLKNNIEIPIGKTFTILI